MFEIISSIGKVELGKLVFEISWCVYYKDGQRQYILDQIDRGSQAL